MSRTIFIQPIFVPDEKRFQRNLDSINSFINYCEKNNVKIDCIFGGWGKEEYMTKIIDILSRKDLPFNVVSNNKFSKNYGKATVVNYLHKKAEEKQLKYDFILTCDSDIVFKEDEPNMIERLEKASERLDELRNKKTGLIALQQEGHCCHWEHKFQNKLDFEEQVKFPNRAEGIAGGCLFIRKEAWDKIGGYRVLGVYAGDDAYMMIDMVRNGYTIQLCTTISIIHPHDTDEEYQKWKNKVCQRDSAGGKVKSNLDTIIKEAEDFWGKR